MKTILEEYINRANSGDVRSMTQLGNWYLRGDGFIDKNSEESIKWFKMAADKGDVRAMKHLGVIYLRGIDVTQDTKEAVRWLKMAADKGEFDAIHAVAIICESDTTTSELLMAADEVDIRAMMHIESMYENGLNTDKYSEEAIKWFKMAADKGDAKAMNNLGVMYQTGFTSYVEYDEDTGESCILQIKIDIDKNSEEAIKWFKMATDKGDAKAMNNLGVMYQNGDGIDKNSEEAIKWFKMAANKGDAKAMIRLGDMYRTGDNIDKNSKEAVKWYKMTANNGDVEAMFILGFMYSNGYDAEQDSKEAVKWLRKAACMSCERHNYFALADILADTYEPDDIE